MIHTPQPLHFSGQYFQRTRLQYYTVFFRVFSNPITITNKILKKRRKRFYKIVSASG